MTDIVYLLTVAILLCSCTAQEEDNCNRTTIQQFCNAQGTDNCNGAIIRGFSELQSYIMTDETIITNLTEAFFRTGRDPSQFVRIKYTYASNETGCSHLRNMTASETYIWSESPIYLLGPKPLQFLTLFAINIAEIGVEVPLPCLCQRQVDALLSRLTYLVSVCCM